MKFRNDYFEKIIVNANAIRQELSDIPEYKEGQVHFRPTSSGITMVSLLTHSAQLGKGGYKAGYLKTNIKEEYHRHCEARTPGRTTPEKQLQSYLISNAYKNNRKLAAFKDASSNAALDTLFFIGDEFVVLDESGSKLICDLLALRTDGTAVVPVLFELKSKRAMLELSDQLTNFTSSMEKWRPQFEQFYSAVFGKDIQFTAKPEKWLVWPAGGTGEDRRQGELASKGIGVVQFSLTDGSYRFHVGNRPMI